MKRNMLIILVLCLLLSGCSWLDGNYVSVMPHKQSTVSTDSQEAEAANYLQLRTALEEMVDAGMTNQVIRVGQFQADKLEVSLDMACRHVQITYPMGAYAVDEITWEVGTSGGVTAVAVQISYLHDYADLQRIHRVRDMQEVSELVSDALAQYQQSVVMLVENYETTDTAQLVADFAMDNPSLVMEIPEVKEQTYPSSGTERVLELKFSYQSSREDLRSMQTQVQRIFNSAALYVSADATQEQKFSQLYAFLMERFAEYQIKTSITPAYSLLNHGVGDSRSFATVYAQMCREAGLTCRVVVGTKNGEPWFWNMIREGEYDYHVDLLACREAGSFRMQTDGEMEHYVWDYSAYPQCLGEPEPPVIIVPQEPKPTETEAAEAQPTEAPETEETSSTQPQTEPVEETLPSEPETEPEETTLPEAEPMETTAPETEAPTEAATEAAAE